MTRAQIAKIISARPEKSYKVIHVKCRPPEKSNKVLVTVVRGRKWYSERPKYFFSVFDRSFLAKGYLAEENLLYPDIKEPLGLFDSKGRWWAREEMSSFGLVKLFLKNPTLYLWIMSRHTQNVKNIVQTIKNIAPTLTKPKFFKQNLKTFTDLYYLMCEAQGSIYTTFDELVWQFRELLLKYLKKEQVNTYFPQFLAGEATKHALEKGYVKERGMLEYVSDRGVLYAKDLKPRAFYSPPHFFPDFHQDAEIINSLIENKVTKEDLQKFFAFRVIVPLGFQINEESQYAETAVLSAHLGTLVKSLSKNIKLPIEKIKSLPLKVITGKLK